MIALLLKWAFGAVLATIGLGLAWIFAPGRRELELDIYVLLLGGMALVTFISWLRQATPESKKSPLEDALHRRRGGHPEPIAELERLERELYLGATTAFDLHYRLRPVLREIVATCLESRALELDADDPRVREALGDELWQIVRPDREPPEDRHAAGPGFACMRRVVEQLEAVS